MNPRDQANETGLFLMRALGPGPSASQFTARCLERINTAGDNDYYDRVKNEMLFETLSADQLFGMVEEELLDAANYAYMIADRDEKLSTGGQSMLQIAAQIFLVWVNLEILRRKVAEDEPITTEYEATQLRGRDDV